MRQPVEIKTRYDFTNKVSVINKIEQELVSLDVMKDEEQLTSNSKEKDNSFNGFNNSPSKNYLKYSNDYTSESLSHANRNKLKDMKDLKEKIKKIKQKKRLTDYIIVFIFEFKC